ncbi:FkbM family methyltransferase [Bradyrhizobium cenepequi]|uniref:FkbM family methyltransferase n=1 Tax=Bradyrhizobium cenepequi TaxID=2821403 RepID=UPI001CE24815|nr:FkbM family methyltransferase [Bradyrhizobium cenepequi]MCA6106953.1 FkbM family methyltransferase [Bradyrhizobium cenepequi]
MNDNQVFLGYPFSDLAALAKYRKSVTAAGPGFHVDCFGIKTRYSYFSDAADSQAVQPNLPFPDNSLYGEAVEFLATCRAVDAAVDEMVVYEFGAGFAPWLVCTAAMALQRPMKRLKLVAVEADPERLPLIEQHFADNNLPRPGAPHPIVSTEIIHAAVSDQRGTLSFSAQGIKDWGGAASKDSGGADYRGATGDRVSVPALPISELLQREPIVDLVHMDIQGFEYLSISASLNAFCSKIKSVVIGTHSRVIEGQLIDLLRRHDWVLIYEKPCKFHTTSQLPDVTGATYFDGTQFWINTRLWPANFSWQPDLTPQATAALTAVGS